MAERVQCPKVADGCEIHQTAIVLVKSRAGYDVTKFAARGGKGFGPPVIEVAWCWWPRWQRSMSGVVNRLTSAL